MNIICPSCQKMLTVSEQNAGQPMNCPTCGKPLTVPALPQELPAHLVLGDLPPEVPLAPLPPEPEQSTANRVEGSAPGQDTGVYQFVPEPPKPAPPPPPPRRERVPTTDTSARSRTPPQPVTPPPPPTQGYTRAFALQLNPQVLTWIAPIGLTLVFLLCFFSWNGAYPGGYDVYTQSAFQAIYGGHSVDQVADERVFNNSDSKIKENISAHMLMLFYVLLLIGALALAAAPIFTRHTGVQLPVFFQRIWPWRSALAALTAGLALLVLVLEISLGFGLENAITKTVVGSQTKIVNTAEEAQKITQISQGAELGRYNLRRTDWFDLAVLLHLVAVAALGLGYFSERRQQQGRPLPQIQLHW